MSTTVQPTRTVLAVAALLLFTIIPTSSAARMAFHFEGVKHAGCKSGTYDVQLATLKFTCNEEDDLCRPGDTVTVHGHFQADKVLPVDITTRVKACKYYGTLCSSTQGELFDSFKDEWGITSYLSNSTYPEPGTYAFSRTFVMPQNSLTDYAYAGLHFDLVADMQADDTSSASTFVPHLRCHAQFTTVNYDTYKADGSVGSGFSSAFGSKWSFVAVVSCLCGYAGLMARKRRIQLSANSPLIDLGHDSEHDHDHDGVATNFEMMVNQYGGGRDYGGEHLDSDSVRV